MKAWSVIGLLFGAAILATLATQRCFAFCQQWGGDEMVGAR